MTGAELYQWMTDPSLLNKSSLQELKQMVDDYPYFHAVRMLYLKNLAVLDDIRLEKELKKMSIYVPDRRRLFLLINDKRFNEIVSSSRKKPSDAGVNRAEDVFDVMDRVLSPEASAPPVPPSVATSDYAGWLEANREDFPSLAGTDNRMKHQDLIDSFLEGDGIQLVQNTGATAGDDTSENITSEKISLDDSYFTETLARVYLSQKRYDKALEIIRTLSLKYPEKNIYFADQIRYLEKIINIKK